MYKLIDERGSVLHTTDNAASAIQWYNNNDDICVDIEPRPSDEELQHAQVTLQAAELERLSKLELTEAPQASLSSSIAPQPTIASSTLLSAKEAALAIQRSNERKYDEGLKLLINALIDNGGSIEAPQLSSYEIAKLTGLGYYVSKRKGIGTYSVSVDAEAPVVPVYTEAERSKEQEEQFKHVSLGKVHIPKSRP